MPLEIIDYLPINDNLLVFVNSSDFAIFWEASHSADSLLPRIGTLNASFFGITFFSSSHPPKSYLLCDFFLSAVPLCTRLNISTLHRLCAQPMMTSKEVAKCDAVETRRRSPLDQLPPPANSNKPLTPFSIEDILNKPSVKRSYAICGTAHLISSSEKHRPTSIPLSSRALLTQTSPLCALEELASKTFKGLEVSVLQAAEGTFLLPKIQHKPFSWPKHCDFFPYPQLNFATRVQCISQCISLTLVRC